MVEVPNARPSRNSGTGGPEFINPYNFISTPPRTVDSTHALGDRPSPSHGTFAPGLYSARIPIRLTTRSPLLIPDQPRARRSEGRPTTLSTRLDSEGGALLNGSTVKGLIRAAFEAITNSRYGLFDERHALPGAIRTDPERALSLSPAVIREIRQSPTGEPVAIADRVKSLRPVGYAVDPLPAVWLPIDEVGCPFSRTLPLETPTLDRLEVYAWIHLQRHPSRKFYMWRVSDLALTEDKLPTVPQPPRDASWTEDCKPVRVKGIVHWTDGQFNGKHDERLVVTRLVDDDREFASLETEPVLIGPAAMREWSATLESYARAHDGDSERERSRLATYIRDSSRWALTPGRTLHLRCNEQHRATKVSPAMIGRDVFPLAPREVADPDHLPARTAAELSAADRVFGWVADKRDKREAAAVKGHLRVTAPRVVESDSQSVTPTPNGELWLTTLNGPKSSQYRFYAIGESPLKKSARDVNDGYVTGNRLRGRKVYLPHVDTIGPGAHSYWRAGNPAHSVRVNNGRSRYPEFVAVDRSKPKVSVQIKDWIPAGTVFTSEIFVDNLTETELGALLWLLAVPEPGVFTMGLGKPLGFGATRVEADWDEVFIYDHQQLRSRYTSLTTAAAQSRSHAGSAQRAQQLVNDFDSLLSSDPAMATVRAEVLNSLFGYAGYPVHYPRVIGENKNNPSAPRRNGYEWWVANERAENRHALPRISDGTPPTLPYLPKNKGR